MKILSQTNLLQRAGFRVVKLLQTKSFRAFWVGGIVRDTLLKRKSDNLDIATDAKPSQIEEILRKHKIYHKPVGIRFGSILAIVDKSKIEITTFRSESRYSDRRHPDRVSFIKDYLQDAKRRDFSINALYFDPIKKKFYDPVSGIMDLKLKLIRFVGDPKRRIDEDPLRMMRGVRLAIQLGFKLEKNAFAAIKARAKFIQNISGERVKAELDKILLSQEKVEGLRLLDATGLLRFILPEIISLKGFSHHSKDFHLEGDMFEHTLLALRNKRVKNLDLIYAILFHDIGKPASAHRTKEYVKTGGHAETGAEMFKNVARRLKIPRKNRDLILKAIANHMTPLRFTDLSEEQKGRLALDQDADFLIQLSNADDSANFRRHVDGSIAGGRSKKLVAAKRFLSQARKRAVLVEKLGNAGLIMKYGNLMPGKYLGQKIQDVKIQIILGKIKNESDLRSYLRYARFSV